MYQAGSGAHVLKENISQQGYKVAPLWGSISYVTKVGFRGQPNKGWGAHQHEWSGSVPGRGGEVLPCVLPACLSPSALSRVWPRNVPRSGGQRPSQAPFPLGSLLCDPCPGVQQARQGPSYLVLAPQSALLPPGQRAVTSGPGGVSVTLQLRREARESAAEPSSPDSWPFCQNCPWFCFGEAQGDELLF